MAEASRQFDISWLDEATKKSAPGPDLAVLKVLQEANEPRHVVDIASALAHDFNETLQAVLALAGSNYVTIVKRDDTAGDHLVELTPRGRQALETA
jgi:hypothetical protein